MANGSLEPPMVWRKQDWAYTRVRGWILDGTLQPGQRIDQDGLASDLTISRVPLRQALVRLRAEGLVHQQPHQRWLVADVSLQNARDVYAGREVLEELLTRTAASIVVKGDIDDLSSIVASQEQALNDGDLQQARVHDRAFHNRIYEVTGLDRTWQAQQQLRGLSDRYIAMFMSNIERTRTSMADHHAIIGALREGRSAEAGSLAAAHVAGGIRLLEDLLSD